jgi:hypothetical protein
MIVIGWKIEVEPTKKCVNNVQNWEQAIAIAFFKICCWYFRSCEIDNVLFLKPVLISLYFAPFRLQIFILHGAIPSGNKQRPILGQTKI